MKYEKKMFSKASRIEIYFGLHDIFSYMQQDFLISLKIDALKCIV